MCHVPCDHICLTQSRLSASQQAIEQHRADGTFQMPLIKWVAKNLATSKRWQGAADDEAAETFHQVGFGAASLQRRQEMDAAGLAWRVAKATKEEKKADQARRKLLAGAKHLMK